MDFQMLRNTFIKSLQKREKLLMPVARLAFRKDCTGRDVECRKQSRGPVANIVVRYTFGVAQSHRQDWLSAVERLNLAFFVDAQHQRVIRWIEVQACHPMVPANNASMSRR